MGRLNLQVRIDERSGFCFGVVYAIEIAERYLATHPYLYCLGDIVHNDMEVERLRAKGLRIITHEEFAHLRDETVLIRAHGEPPSTYRTALANNIRLLDASCPVVLKLQNRVRKSYDRKSPTAAMLVYGKQQHAEVKGILGQIGQDAIVIEDVAAVDRMDLPDEVILFSQTTKSTQRYYALRDRLEAKGIRVQFHDTICRQVSNRHTHLADFARSFDRVVFVAGRKSSNGKVLYEVVKQANPQSYFISHPDELQPGWFHTRDRVGVCGATSTPQWLMDEVKATLEKW